MENLTFVVFGMNGRFFDEIAYSAFKDGISFLEWDDYCAMMCSL